MAYLRDWRKLAVVAVLVLVGLAAGRLASQAVQAKKSALCLYRMRVLSLVVQTYTMDWDERLPLATNWCAAIEPYAHRHPPVPDDRLPALKLLDSEVAQLIGAAGGPEALFQCPSRRSARCSFGYNSALAGTHTADIGGAAGRAIRDMQANATPEMSRGEHAVGVVLLFESEAGWNAHGDLRAVSWGRHPNEGRDRANFAFLDGSARACTAREVAARPGQ